MYAEKTEFEKFVDWFTEPPRWKCPNCNKLHENENTAENCCTKD